MNNCLYKRIIAALTTTYLFLIQLTLFGDKLVFFDLISKPALYVAVAITAYTILLLAISEEYLNRIDKTFAFNDTKNCERIYKEIKKL